VSHRARAWLLLLAAACAGPAAAQNRQDPRFDSTELEPAPEAPTEGAPQLRFDLLEEIELEGPLAPSGVRRAGDHVEVEAADGTAVFSWDADLSLTRVDAVPDTVPDTAEELSYGISPDGKVRAVTRADGFIVAEKLCARCSKRWKKKWRIRAPGDEFARPVVTARRVFYGTTDNRVFAVKRRNGHRVWAADIPGRVVRPLELVRVQAPPELAARGKSKDSLWLDLILVVPASGRTLIALDARNGERVASFDLEEDEMLVGAPLARDGHIVVARQKYEANDAALLVLRLSPAGPFPLEETAPAPEPQASGGAPVSGGAG
jgi:outer membrane protein assembly factor BamB